MIPPVNLDHLDWLRRDAGGYTTWQIYASPVTPGDRQGPYKHVGDDDEGVGCIDDVARAAILYARHYARTGVGDPQARQAYAFIAHEARTDGTYYNFVWEDGKPNTDGPTSRPGLNWWTARALWALGEGARAYRAKDPAFADELRRRAAPTLAALEADLAKRDGAIWRYGAVTGPGWFVADGPDVTAVTVLGLAALQADRPEPRLRHLIERYGAAIAAWTGTGVLAGAHLPGLGPAGWHAYGAHMLNALAEGARVTGSPTLLAAAREEADTFYPRLLALGGPVAGFTPALETYPQIAYGVEPAVLGLLSLEAATHEPRYGVMAGLFASWLTGNNPAGVPMYDARTGRVCDGVDPKGASQDSGAESTIEGLLTLEALAARPELEPYVFARTRGVQAATYLDLERLVLAPGAVATLRTFARPGPYQATLVVERARYEPARLGLEWATIAPSGLEHPAGRQAFALQWPPADAPWVVPAPLELRLQTPATLRFTLEGAHEPVTLLGAVLVPAVEYRLYDTTRGPVGIAYNHGEATTLPGFPAPLPAHASSLQGSLP